ncbi:sodium-dependent neutral amino acid transporter B(0)AT2-like [Astyanax mexicanus]|uniref:sodium-dependent neutral amino acid transporter B(0)AT2-like n=1 Tax=Astyanax mexicanus TaxID=7994 RepID=UPI0020CAD4E9|nr:sodium-dependent neutral amino acid transporter B(0)AT2-like [Astyanax mexicanus]
MNISKTIMSTDSQDLDNKVTVSKEVGLSIEDPCADSLNESSLALSAPAEDAAHQAEEGTVTDEDERPAWSSKFLYILAQVGFSVGLGNVWRFPYLCQKNGGGAFLVPYVILLLLIGIPLFFLELAVGQLIRRGCIGVWNHISPRLGGIGFASFVAGFFAALYYNVIVGWSIFYFTQSFQEPLPWKDCPLITNATGSYIVPECEKSSATTYYWYREALDISDSISESGGLNWKMTLCLLGAWIIVCLSMMKGIQTSGKVVYFSSLFPYLVLFCFLVRAMLLEGSVDGIVHMFTPKIEIMLDPTVWRDAAIQIFFALGLGCGGVIAFSSYNKKDNNCHSDAVLVSFINFFTSILATLVVFAVLGFKANIVTTKCVELNTQKIVGYLGTEISYDVIPPHIDFSKVSREDYQQIIGVIRGVKENDFSQLGLDSCDITEELNQGVQGTGLAFIAFTEAMTHFPGSPFWSVMFFLMLTSLGLGSMFGNMEGIITPIVDTFKIRKEYITVGCCILSFFVGLMFVQRSGNYFVSMMDEYSASLPLLPIVFLENVAVAWIYGTDRFYEDLKEMLGFRPFRVYYYMWKYITPLLLLAMLVASLVQMGLAPPTYTAWIQELAQEQSLSFPPWGLAVCITLMVIAILPLPVVFCLRHCNIKNKNAIMKESARHTREDEEEGKASSSMTSSSSSSSRKESSSRQTDHETNSHDSANYVVVDITEMTESVV